MFNLGVATSIAKNNNYSWQDTINFAHSLNLNSIQLYVPEEKSIPKITPLNKFEYLYLHIPNDYADNYNDLLPFIVRFKNQYNCNKIILHHNEKIEKDLFFEIISKFNDQGIIVGIENDAKSDLFSYFNLIKTVQANKYKIFLVLDIHRFFFNHSQKNDQDSIVKMIFDILDYIKEKNLAVLLHIIDSTSFLIHREHWVAMFEGIVPYPAIMNYIINNSIKIESIIFEYETKNQVQESIRNFKKIVTNFSQNSNS